MKLENVCVNFGENTILKNFSCQFKTGDFVLLKGANGSGKTTLAKILAGEFFNYEGDYYFNSEKVTPSFDVFKNMALVKCNARENFVFGAVYDEIAFPLKNLKLKKNVVKEKVKAVCNFLGIFHLVGKNTCELSEGERQLVALAGFLVFRPKLLILDEALVSVEEEKRKEILENLKTMALRENLTFVYISNLKEDESFFTQVLNLGGSEGRLFKISEAKLKASEKTGEAKKECKTVLQLKNFSVIKQKQKVLKGINLTLNEGEVVALCAKNASGKTTFAHALCGFNDFDGEFLLCGESVKNKTQLYKEVGIVFQAAENFLCRQTPLRELTQNANEKDALELAEKLGITALLNRPLEELSTGEKRIVAVACAIIKKPKVLILDEVFGALSGFYKTKLLLLLKTLCKEKMAILFISHSEEESQKIANRIFRLQAQFEPMKQKNIVLGRCLSGETVVHKIPAFVKILAAVIFTVCVFVFKNPWVLGGFGAFTVAALAFAKVSPKTVFLYTRPLIIITLSIFVLNWLTVSFNVALLVLVRLSLVNIFVPIITLTSTPLQIMNAISFSILPLKRFKKAKNNFGAVCIMAIACLPEGSEFIKNIVNWQRSLNIVYSKKKFYKKIIQHVSLFVPLVLFLKQSALLKANLFISKGFNYEL